MSTVIFAHGKLSTPKSGKVKHLASIARDYGHRVLVPDYTETLDPDRRLQMLCKMIENEQTDDLILAGSSMGGFIATVAATRFKVRGLFLLAPALYRPHYPQYEYDVLADSVTVVHGWFDEVAPPESSIKFASTGNYPLHMLADGHSLSNSLGLIGGYFRLMLKELGKKE
ncbi:alpha/beta hydrolase [bacterium]|jgi:pimeloyl-ACP methyl ester carboxylesterase|nr:alpha/beta hydrolase [bacterium]